MYFECFLRKMDTGLIMASKIAPGTMLPATANKYVLVAERPSSLPSGMASFRSSGVIAEKNTVISVERVVIRRFTW